VKNSCCLCRTYNVCVGQHDFSVKNTIDSKWQTERQQQQGEVFGSAHLADDASSFFFGSWVPVVRCERLPALDIMHTWLLDGLMHVAHGGLPHNHSGLCRFSSLELWTMAGTLSSSLSLLSLLALSLGNGLIIMCKWSAQRPHGVKRHWLMNYRLTQQHRALGGHHHERHQLELLGLHHA
jgi:hypothetical protein